MQIIYILLAILGLGILVFIHELGHYFMARRVKMKVEVFSIGFGKPIYSWVRHGVVWQIGMLPFGGYVKIAGMHKEKGKEPHEIPNGFFGKKPIDRIKVALAGPVINLLFALLIFTVIYLTGGREKPFSQFTHKIGWVDESSELYTNGVRPGDEIVEYDGRPYTGIKDLIYASVMAENKLKIEGYKIDYFSTQKIPIDYTINTYKHPNDLKDNLQTIGVLAPAMYLIYDANNGNNTSLANSGIKSNDRIIWVNGELVFSSDQLSHILNESTTFLTVQRQNQIFQTRVPRIQTQELKLKPSEKNEFEDWKFESDLSTPVSDLYFIPYSVSTTGMINGRTSFIDPDDQKTAFSTCVRCSSFTPLQKGDKIIAVDGEPIANSYDILKKLQTKKAIIIVQRDNVLSTQQSWKDADEVFDKSFPILDLKKVISSIGTKNPMNVSKEVIVLKPITLKTIGTMQENPIIAAQIAISQKNIEAIEDPTQKKQALSQFERSKNTYLLGISLKDKKVTYNPGPFHLFYDVFSEIQRTFIALVTGYLSPKYLSGPIGIMQVVHHGWSVGVKEALYWMGMISLNLGILNLLPIPVLDGGHIIFSLIEVVTKKPLKAKTMEWLIIPFVVLLIAFFIYVTYHDLYRLVQSYF